MRTSVTPDGFVYGIHKPSYTVHNLRTLTRYRQLGSDETGTPVTNEGNYPDGNLHVAQADWIYEIANPFPFRGATFIGKSWAEKNADNPERIRLPEKPETSLTAVLKKHGSPELLEQLPRPLLLSLATASTDPNDLIRLARLCCRFDQDENGTITGLRYIRQQGTVRPEISDHALFEAVANNPALPDNYKIAMVIMPGAQGASEIVGDYHHAPASHIYEYMRRNSYIGGGHYAANMSEQSIRYHIDDLNEKELFGLRHLYYQRTYIRLAALCNIEIKNRFHTPEELETLRTQIIQNQDQTNDTYAATLWGWNFGFDYASSGYRLHASHQQVHQQYALIPTTIEGYRNGCCTTEVSPFAAGDLIAEVICSYHDQYGRDFFTDYLAAIRANRRMDNRHGAAHDLVIWEDKNVMLFVPKAQTSQWELQIMTKPKEAGFWPGNIIETDSDTRTSLDRALLKAQQCLAARGARMVTSIEYSKRLTAERTNQPLIYCLMVRLPESPGAFSETQHRFINGHFPEDFAAICKKELNHNRE